jgi:methionyl-tRNA formyltransferase
MNGRAADREGLFLHSVNPGNKSVVFLGSKPIGYQCLQHLLGMQHSLGFEVAGILTQKRAEFDGDNDLTQLAAENSVPVFASLDEMPVCDIIYSVQYHELLKQRHIAKAQEIAVNLHMAPLPEYRGSNQFSLAIIEEKQEFGTTIHRIDTRIDHGDILFEKRFPIPSNCWVKDLYDLTEAASLALFRESLSKIIAADYTLKPQGSLEDIRGTSLHFRREMAAMKAIDLSWDASKISRHIRATAMPGFEPPYTIIGGRKVYFTVQADEPA